MIGFIWTKTGIGAPVSGIDQVNSLTFVHQQGTAAWGLGNGPLFARLGVVGAERASQLASRCS
ncbi:hypothetical protein [Alicyclobacillus fodiniaquatilis]|uniref:hypothetical protein n=1 Tax=Alicyclobacillus fodiniaquatilis TaxID=1661150 RepID=UPI00366F1BA4